MSFTRSIVTTASLLLTIASLASCGGSDSGSGPGGSGSSGGFSGVFTSVDSDEIRFEFKSGGTVVASMGDEQGKPGTFTLDGEKVIVDFGGQKTTFIRDGDCLTDAQNLFGTMCKGGKAGAASNVSTRDLTNMREGTWVATNADGEFTIAFKPGEKFTFSFVPVAGSQLGDKPMTREGTYVVEGDTLYTTLDDSTPMVLKFVNNAYESMAFGLPMKFTKR
jgi:hypothetical protein